MIINGIEYCILMRGQYGDCKKQDYWSNWARNKFGADCDPYWTTAFNENNELEDVLYVRKDKRYLCTIFGHPLTPCDEDES